MTLVAGVNALFSILPKKRLGVFRLFGTSQFGFSNFGDEDIYFQRNGFGDSVFGVVHYADIILLSGIYRTNTKSGHHVTVYNKYYITKNPRTETQQANRQKYADGIVAWQNLTNGQKAVYNKRAIGRKMSGYNLFLKEYLLSN